MADDDTRLAVLIEANTKSYENAMKRLEQKTDRAMKAARKDTQKLSREMTRLETISARTASGIGRRFGALIAAGGIIQLGRHFLSVGGDIEEMESKFNAVFKDMSSEVDRWARSHAAAVSRSALDLKNYLSTLQDTFVPLGFAREQGAALSKQLVELAVDVASFSNAAEPDVINNFTSAIVGNHEAVRRFGIVITQATLNQELLRMGIKGGAQAASEQAKVLARLNIIMNSTKDAQGDAEKTAGSYTNTMKGLSGAWTEFSANVGGFLTTVATPLLGFFKDGIEGANLFLDSLRSVENRQSVKGLRTVLVDIYDQRQKLIDKNKSLDGFWGNIAGGTATKAILSRNNDEIARLNSEAGILLDRINEMEHGTKGGEDSPEFKPTFKPPTVADLDNKGLAVNTKARDKAIKTYKREQQSVTDLIASLELERQMIGQTDVAYRTANTIRNMAASATDAQKNKVAELIDEINRERQAYEALENAQGFLANSAFDSLVGVIDKTKSASEAMRDFAKQIAMAGLQAAFLGSGPFAAPGGGPGIFGTIFGSLLGRPMAGGGAIAGGVPRLVGERGPELFIPRTAGSVVPNNMVNNHSSKMNINVNVHGAKTDREIRELVMEGVGAGIKQASPSIVGQAVAATQDSRRTHPTRW